MEDKKLNLSSSLAASRGLAILIAILWHVDILLASTYPDYQVHGKIFKVLWYIPLPLFFFLLGNAFSLIIQRDRIGLIASAIGSYLYLYIVWLLLYHVLFYSLDRGTNEVGLIPLIKHVLFPAPELWFIIWMACCLLICTLTRRIAKATLVLSSALITVIVTTSGYKIQNFLIYNLFFTYVGIYTRDIFLQRMQNFSGIIFISCAAAYIPIAYLTIPYDAFAMPALALVGSMLGILTVTSGMAVLQKKHLVRPLAVLGRNSFATYLIAPFWIAIDLKGLLWCQISKSDQATILFQESSYVICALVVVQSLLTIHALGKNNWLLSAPAIARHKIDLIITRILRKYSVRLSRA